MKKYMIAAVTSASAAIMGCQGGGESEQAAPIEPPKEYIMPDGMVRGTGQFDFKGLLKSCPTGWGVGVPAQSGSQGIDSAIESRVSGGQACNGVLRIMAQTTGAQYLQQAEVITDGMAVDIRGEVLGPPSASVKSGYKHFDIPADADLAGAERCRFTYMGSEFGGFEEKVSCWRTVFVYQDVTYGNYQDEGRHRLIMPLMTPGYLPIKVLNSMDEHYNPNADKYQPLSLTESPRAAAEYIMPDGMARGTGEFDFKGLLKSCPTGWGVGVPAQTEGQGIDRSIESRVSGRGKACNGVLNIMAQTTGAKYLQQAEVITDGIVVDIRGEVLGQPSASVKSGFKHFDIPADAEEIGVTACRFIYTGSVYGSFAEKVSCWRTEFVYEDVSYGNYEDEGRHHLIMPLMTPGYLPVKVLNSMDGHYNANADKYRPPAD